MGLWERLRRADRDAVQRIAQEEAQDTGEGWRFVLAAAAVFALATMAFLATEGWLQVLGAAVGAVFLGALGIRKYRLARSDGR